MKAYQKGICLAVATVMMAGCLTGCGSTNIGGFKKGGTSSMEECAKADDITLYEGDVDAYLNLVPEELIEYWENEYLVTRDQITEMISEWYRPKDEEVVKEQVKNIENAEMDDRSYEYQLHDVQEVNEWLFGGVLKADEIYYIHLSNDVDDSVCSCHVFKYDGKWYSLSAVIDITESLD